MSVDLTAAIFNDDAKAREWLEAARWPNGLVCAHCGSNNVHRLEGEAHRAGLLYCRACRKQFSVTVGSVMERSHVPLPKWVLAFHLMASSKKGMSAHQMHRMLKVTYKTAWFMAHRIREAMTDPNPSPIGGEGKVVEADETYYGNKDVVTKRTIRGKPSHGSKRPVVALVERGGEVRAVHMPKVTAKNVAEVLEKHADKRSRLYTDESNLYPKVGAGFAAHETVLHSKGEYARGPKGPLRIHTNNAEGYFGVFKRGMRGVYQHCGEQHLQRYLNEFSFRHNTRAKLGFHDTQRAVLAIKGMAGKRLTYRRTDAGQDA